MGMGIVDTGNDAGRGSRPPSFPPLLRQLKPPSSADIPSHHVLVLTTQFTIPSCSGLSLTPPPPYPIRLPPSQWQIVEKGGLELVSGAIVSFPLDAVVCRTALSLFRNISGNDLLKTRLLREGGLRLVLGCMSQHKGDKTLQV